jgi:hypothetical protein
MTTSPSTPTVDSFGAAPFHDIRSLSDPTDSLVGRFSPCEEERKDAMETHHGQPDDVRVLLNVIQLLSNLASMEAHTYESSLWNLPSKNPHSHSSPLAQPDDDDASTSCKFVEADPSSILPSVSALLREYDFDSHTAVPQLVRSVHRLQSNQLCLQRELEKRESQVNELQTQLGEFRQQHHKLGNENSHLRCQLIKVRDDKRILKEAVRRYQAINESQSKQIRQLQLVNQVLRVRDHEHLLRAKRPRISSDDAPVIGTPVPHYPGSKDVLWKRKERQCGEDGTEATDASTVTPTTNPMRTFVTMDEDDDTNSMPSFIHTIPDSDGMATVRFLSPADAYETSESFNDSSSSSLDDHSTIKTVSPCSSPIPWPSQSPIVGHCHPVAPYTRIYTLGSKMGLRVRPVELESVQDSKTHSSRRPLIPTESLMGQNPTLTASPSMGVRPTDDPSFSNHFGSLLGKKPTTPSSTSPRLRQAFLVCGYTDADSSASSSFRRTNKPPIGARIVAVNGQPVRDSWTFTEFLDRMKYVDGSKTIANAANGSSTEDESPTYYTVTFRNDRLTERQWEQLAIPNRGTASASSCPAVTVRPSSTKPDQFDREDRAASDSVKVLLDVGPKPRPVAASLPSKLNPQSPAAESNSGVLSSISSSFWSKAAEIYAS